jgi:hypothetical protein
MADRTVGEDDAMAADPSPYLDTLDEPRRSDVARLHELVHATLPELEVHATDQRLGYGPFHYRYATGREGDDFHVSIVSRKTGVSLYVLSTTGDRYVPELFADRLPKASVGKSCVRMKRIDDVDAGVLAELLKKAGEHPPAGAV